MDIVVDDKIVKACRIFFGIHTEVNSSFLSTLHLANVKTVFRKKALLCHPDRVLSGDEAKRKQYTEQFIEVNWAREQLLNFFREQEKKASVRPKVKRTQPRYSRKHEHEQARPRYSRTKHHGSEAFYSGPLPLRRLRFGEYLYYSGVVSWNSFIKALVWQRQQRPRFGELALRFRYLAGSDIDDLLRRKHFFEPVGEAAVRLSLMNRFQVGAVIFHQRFIQRPIGQYFVEHSFLGGGRVSLLHEHFLRHNSRFRKV